jgi:arginine decarboxylase
MNTKYSDLINQTYYFPQDEFTLNKDNLKFHNVDLMKPSERNIPLKFTYLPQTTSTRPKLFRKSMEKK